jgi:hypothetical protein
MFHYELAFLDPLFWQALGEARRWRKDTDAWRWFCHRFIEHLAEGEDAENFFEELLVIWN